MNPPRAKLIPTVMPERNKRRLMLLISWLVGLYLASALIVRIAYRWLLYPAPRTSTAPSAEGASLRRYPTGDGHEALALVFPARGDAPTIVHFHGNGEMVDGMIPIAERLAREGLGVALVEYRGYGCSPGAPTEAGLYADAEAVLDGLGRDGVGRERIVLWGTSLGTGVATEMAFRGRGQRLLLIAPYTSITELVARYVPWLPVRWLIADLYETREKLPKLTMPILIIHGTEDEVVPYRMGLRLRDQSPRVELRSIEGGHHNDLYIVDPTLSSEIASWASRR